ncbi:uncharacterized protein LOC106462418 isoform X1 [Limulus polyphemus]|uniref:Uncharacterized protein LOC106462418 isoform X1 n=3 Tax=Limulus polyphemus TaxID=6850 RepID=A0ABM1SP23_LIMPO|nr:uncharacterized protein LOC106462418 isoform X1 [Limulus polyphemus]XP_022245379.1 uncharacterized protein LOC106462418 isoform X1 [Limulus polyphemus]XP_022245380.1 uncharacterized protein LOC106462418 isoform X1 [Limulus polyphemus]
MRIYTTPFMILITRDSNILSWTYSCEWRMMRKKLETGTASHSFGQKGMAAPWKYKTFIETWSHMGCANTKTGAAAAPQEVSGGTETTSVKSPEHTNTGVTDGTSSDPENSHSNGQTNGDIDTENSTGATGQNTGDAVKKKDVNSKEAEPASEANTDAYTAKRHEETAPVISNEEAKTQSDTQKTEESAENKINEDKMINEDATSKTIIAESTEENATKAIEEDPNSSPNDGPDSGEKPQDPEAENAELDNTITNLDAEKDKRTEDMGENGCGEEPITTTKVESGGAKKENVEV